MATIQLRKKSLRTWLHIDSVSGEFILSKFYVSFDGNKMQIVEQGESKRRQYEVTDIQVYDDTSGGTLETFSTITALSLRLEALKYPAFYKDGSNIGDLIDDTADHYKGKWSALVNSPALVNGVGQIGDHYTCDTAGTADFGDGDIIFKENDEVFYDGSKWFKFIDNNQVSGSFVPYTGATADVNLGANSLLFGANSFSNALEFQISDGTTAVRAEPDYMSVFDASNEVTIEKTGVKLKNKVSSSNACTITNANTTGTGKSVTLNTPDKPTGTYTQATLEDFNSFIIQDTAYTLSNTTSLQKIFGVTANGAFNAQANSSYWFECAFDLSGLSTTNSNFSFGLLGTATLTAIRYSASSIKGSLASVNSAASPVTIKTASASVLCASTNQSVGHTIIKGYIRVNAAGTIIPAVGLGAAVGTAQISAGSYFKITPMVATDTVYYTNDFS